MIELTISEDRIDKIKVTVTNDFGITKIIHLGLKEQAMVKSWMSQARTMIDPKLA